MVRVEAELCGGDQHYDHVTRSPGRLPGTRVRPAITMRKSLTLNLV